MWRREGAVGGRRPGSSSQRTNPWFSTSTGRLRMLRAQRSIPLIGFEVSLPEPSDRLERRYAFKICQSHLTVYFSADGEELQRRWMEVLSRAGRGEELQAHASISESVEEEAEESVLADENT
ncbi:hypothetical protein SKAU_G00113550 [Synaphobranchus kaupii]|uniref:PH domain-containing protein n=1 Tax=Synaphobranchus kaupii TaxID=118154 RepID=A0A9Q1J7J8_SYNKA|nr:hypothetical protein SKAU_G00113550 [Synaphobranchus kaupii]